MGGMHDRLLPSKWAHGRKPVEVEQQKGQYLEGQMDFVCRLIMGDLGYYKVSRGCVQVYSISLADP